MCILPVCVLTPPLPLPTAYRNEEGVPWVLPVVRAVEQQMAADETLNKEYLPQEGMGALREVAVRLVLGAGSKALVQNRVGRGGESLCGVGSVWSMSSCPLCHHSGRLPPLPLLPLVTIGGVGHGWSRRSVCLVGSSLQWWLSSSYLWSLLFVCLCMSLLLWFACLML